MKKKSVAKKAEASVLLITMALGLLSSLLAWGGVNLIGNGKEIAVNKANISSTSELLIRIERKVDTLLLRE